MTDIRPDTTAVPQGMPAKPNDRPTVDAAPAIQATQPARNVSPPRGPVRDMELAELVIGLVECVAVEKQRDQAVVKLVQYLARRIPGSTVRCGIGTTRLRRYFDSRLGWLGPASELFERAAAEWEDDSATVSTRPDLAREGHRVETSEKPSRWRLNIDDNVSLGRCVLWIDGVEVQARDRLWLRRCLPLLSTLLWHRSGGMVDVASRKLAGRGSAARLYVALTLILVATLSVWPVSYRVRCTTVVRPDHARVVAAPFAATLLATHVQPGDAVRIGDPLITLDGRPLRLELESIQAQISRVQKERDVALVGGKVAEAQQQSLRIRELSRQRDLLNTRLHRLQVTSPINGIVVAGDLNRSIGAPLETGQAVLEIASLDQMVIELEIPEYEIGYVEPGTTTRVRLAADEGRSIDQTITDVFPAAELREDQNVFIGQIHVNNDDGRLRPGMRGEAIAYGPVRPWLWSFARSGWEKLLWWIGF